MASARPAGIPGGRLARVGRGRHLVFRSTAGFFGEHAAGAAMRLIPVALWMETSGVCGAAVALLAADLPLAPAWDRADVHLAPHSAVLRFGSDEPEFLLAQIPPSVLQRLRPGNHLGVYVLHEGQLVQRLMLPLVGPTPSTPLAGEAEPSEALA